MREIKFRVWVKEESKMIYLDDKENDVEINFLSNITSNHKTYWEVNTKVSDHLHAHMTQYFDSRDNDNVLMQYTGLKDENGKEIYEGDIVFRDILREDEIYVVEYNPSDAGYNPFCVAGEFDDEYILTKHSRVIGNIYENPELLESK
jgi:uncharacterized phage protein (TIGR01671 family)